MVSAFIERRFPDDYDPEEEEFFTQRNDELVDLFEALDDIAMEHGHSMQEWEHITERILTPLIHNDYKLWMREEWESITESRNDA